jgi:PRTRC genetic system protein B
MQFKINNEGDSFQLKSAVLLYGHSGGGQAYASKHEVSFINGRPTIRPGTPLTVDDYTALVLSLKPESRPSVQWLDRRILAKGADRMIWWTPPQHRTLFFKESAHVKGTFTAFGPCPLPALVFMATDRSLYVYAIKGKAEPTRETPLYQAPFFNVWARGEVCSGNALRPSEGEQNNPDAWEKFFFESNFTHPNFREKNRLTLGVDPSRFWRTQPRTSPNGCWWTSAARLMTCWELKQFHIWAAWLPKENSDEHG